MWLIVPIAYHCTFPNCAKSYVDIGAYYAHANEHVKAGHGEFVEPYPWHSPYPSVVESCLRRLPVIKKPQLLYNDSIELS
jgi:hypothetical protein